MMKLRLGIGLRNLDFESNLEQLIHLHIQVIYEYAE
jgi:hypothetical protein